MGDRGNVVMKYENGGKIYFYTHWSGSRLKEIVKYALIRGKDKWNDEQYLARIVFCEMIKDDVLDTTGFGISPYIGDGAETVIIDLKKMTANGKSFENYIKEKQRNE